MRKFLYVVGTGLYGQTELFEPSDFVAVSAGVADAGKPVLLGADGKLDPSVLPQEDVIMVFNTVNTTTSPTPGTETTVTLVAIKRFEITNLGNKPVLLSYQSGESGTQYRTVRPNVPYWEHGIGGINLNLYIQSAGASQRLEIVTGA